MRVLMLFLAVFLLGSRLEAATIRQTERGSVHEAFLPPIKGLALEAIPNQPPRILREKMPMQPDSSSIWIPGYWSWLSDDQDFTWISGVWRRPPLDHHWIPGYWIQTEGGWIYVQGFWTPDTEHELTFIPNPPPDPIEENISAAPGEQYVWIPGYWIYEEDISDYNWVPGQWQPIDPNWVLVPARYVWRPEGYVFIPAFWDWPLETRGRLYANVDVDFTDPVELENVIYEPIAIPSNLLFNRLIIFYPDYVYFYHYYYVTHPEFFVDVSFVPPWWGWPAWWTFNWHNQWALWWWYTHPGYPQPYWIDAAISSRLPPPTPGLLHAVRRVAPPPIVTRNGVVTSNELIHAVSSHHKGKRLVPVIPANEHIKSEIFANLKEEEHRPKTIIEPRGNGEQIKQGSAPIPHLKEKILSNEKRIQGIKIPPKPTESDVQKWHAQVQEKPKELTPPKPARQMPIQPQNEVRQYQIEQNQQLQQQMINQQQKAFEQKQQIQQQQQLMREQMLRQRENYPSYYNRPDSYLQRPQGDLRTMPTPSQTLYSNPGYYSPSGGLYMAPPARPYVNRPTGSSSVDRYYNNPPSTSQQPYFAPQYSYPMGQYQNYNYPSQSGRTYYRNSAYQRSYMTPQNQGDPNRFNDGFSSPERFRQRDQFREFDNRR